MSDTSEDLRSRLVEQSTESLLQMVNVDFADYRDEALEIARAELRRRGIRVVEPKGRNDESTVAEPSERAVEAQPVCEGCGGGLRLASLIADKEIVLSFHDNHELRFLEVLVCQRCGKVKLSVDFETEVHG